MCSLYNFNNRISFHDSGNSLPLKHYLIWLIFCNFSDCNFGKMILSLYYSGSFGSFAYTFFLWIFTFSCMDIHQGHHCVKQYFKCRVAKIYFLVSQINNSIVSLLSITKCLGSWTVHKGSLTVDPWSLFWPPVAPSQAMRTKNGCRYLMSPEA